jgi:hypothetical protein
MSIADVIALMSGGFLQTQRSGTFSFIRLPMFARPGEAIAPSQRPATFNLISSDRPLPSEPAPAVDDAFGDEAESELGPPPDEDPNDNRIAGWREGRKLSAARRKPPGLPN